MQQLWEPEQVVEIKQQANKALKQRQHELIEAERSRSELQIQVIIPSPPLRQSKQGGMRRFRTENHT